MKVVSTKLDNTEFEKFQEKCNEKGCSKSETLREMIKNFSDVDHPFSHHNTVNDKEEEPKKVAKATVVLVEDDEDKEPHHDSYGNYWYWNKRTRKWAVNLDLDNIS